MSVGDVCRMYIDCLPVTHIFPGDTPDAVSADRCAQRVLSGACIQRRKTEKFRTHLACRVEEFEEADRLEAIIAAEATR